MESIETGSIFLCNARGKKEVSLAKKMPKASYNEDQVQSTRGKMIRHNMIRNRENGCCVFTHKNDFPKYDLHGLKQDSEEIIGCLEEEICSTTQ